MAESDIRILSRPPGADFAFQQIPPPSYYYVGPDDRLTLSLFASVSVTLTLILRYVLDNGLLQLHQETLVPSTDRATNGYQINLTECFLVGGALAVTGGNPRRGQCYGFLDIRRSQGASTLRLQRLLQGYLTERVALAFPGSNQEHADSGKGVVRSITGTDPAAGAEISETVPTGALWRVHALRASLVADATAANRLAQILIDDGANVVFEAGAPVTQTASQTINYTASTVGAHPLAVNSRAHYGLPPDLILRPGWRIRTSTSNLQAGDNWSAPQLAVEEWMDQ